MKKDRKTREYEKRIDNAANRGEVLEILEQRIRQLCVDQNVKLPDKAVLAIINIVKK